ncbi:hypothetical protein PT250_03745 [Erysipelothrix rhusiopathiae]|uniref:Uncharacterized protein n=1 Tax=Erysipelothrix rhusiopathiae ATCC 19414 TaxID=525280 RepID=E7FWI2_ERYRH|nr:hypothetical protein [Erysipelothrix rhusiopathiae]AGN25052.1 hypothetical protein K210_07340 [Erysipelothrix rhusiopathiae SY1027]AMS10223.1 hypothetical protein A2I91_00115 [Erysipelothrix rhusiopathiae]AOO67435.1 hypothetical protein BC346_03600 [Erysipelothrix rhusiopathiae]AWU40735.1 hypothetical protein DM789_00265 [Erysipelothrix rhusiopathiae]EFY08514.1 hypothetical protein HMPREF0357_10620 [Erysipelothrix rhusiopathiae ATCC 19414]
MKKNSRIIVFIVCIGVLVLMGLPNYLSKGKLQSIDPTQIDSILYNYKEIEITTQDTNRILDSITLLKSIELKGTTRQLSQPAVTYNMELTFKDEKHMKLSVFEDKLVVDRKVYRIDQNDATILMNHIETQK